LCLAHPPWVGKWMEPNSIIPMFFPFPFPSIILSPQSSNSCWSCLPLLLKGWHSSYNSKKRRPIIPLPTIRL
jgi:hypothetical protein